MYYILILAVFAFIIGSTFAQVPITDPDDKFGWYSRPSVRSTSDILWSCLTTLFICVWASLHLNVPGEGKTSMLRYKLTVMVIGILAPEYLTWIAIAQWVNARTYTKKLRALDCCPRSWTMTHSFYANMGGFVIDVSDRTGSQEGSDDEKKNTDYPPPPLQQYTPVVMNDILSLFEEGVIKIPDIRKEALWDKSKSDSLGKSIACLQASWLALQCMIRAVQELPITTLEIATMGYVFCAVITYAFWWHKPLDVMVPSVIPIADIKSPTLSKLRRSKPRVSDDPYRDPYSSPAALTDLICGVGVLIGFGMIHTLAWNFNFPTRVEQLLWRISTVVITSSGIIFSVGHPIFGSVDSSNPTVIIVKGLVMIVCIFCYGVFRIYLIVEPFMGLRSAPAGIYQEAKWMSFLPHL